MRTSTTKLPLTIVFLFIVYTGSIFANNSVASKTNHLSISDALPSSLKEDLRRKIRLGFTAPNTIHRQLLLTEDERATSGFDWGFDASYYDTNSDDMYWLIDNEKFIIQATNVFDETTTFALGFYIKEAGNSTIEIDGLENIDDDFEIYLYDKEEDLYHNLREGEYEFYSDLGEYLNRFELVFNNPDDDNDEDEDSEDDDEDDDDSQDEDEDEDDDSDDIQLSDDEKRIILYYRKNLESLVLKNTTDVKLDKLTIYGLEGELVLNKTFDDTNQNLEHNIRLNSISKGVCIVILETEIERITKKIMVY